MTGAATARAASLERLLHPRSVAVVGASERTELGGDAAIGGGCGRCGA